MYTECFHSREKVIYKSFEYILKIDSPKNRSPNVRNFNYTACNIRHTGEYFLFILDVTQTLKMHVIVQGSK